MKKVFLFSLFLVLGLVLSQCLPVWLGEAFLTAEKVAKTLMFVCLAFVRELGCLEREFIIEPVCGPYSCRYIVYHAGCCRVTARVDL